MKRMLFEMVGVLSAQFFCYSFMMQKTRPFSKFQDHPSSAGTSSNNHVCTWNSVVVVITVNQYSRPLWSRRS